MEQRWNGTYAFHFKLGFTVQDKEMYLAGTFEREW